jgi:hypothetical protein
MIFQTISDTVNAVFRLTFSAADGIMIRPWE